MKAVTRFLCPRSTCNLWAEWAVANQDVRQATENHIELIRCPDQAFQAAAGYQGSNAQGPGGVERETELGGDLLAAEPWWAGLSDACGGNLQPSRGDTEHFTGECRGLGGRKNQVAVLQQTPGQLPV
jgi:hypothetical protein